MSKNKKNDFRAPQKTLQSSWRDEAFTPAKKRGIVVVNYSRNTRNGVLVKAEGKHVNARFDSQAYNY
jgi:hypothetical protein